MRCERAHKAEAGPERMKARTDPYQRDADCVLREVANLAKQGAAASIDSTLRSLAVVVGVCAVGHKLDVPPAVADVACVLRQWREDIAAQLAASSALASPPRASVAPLESPPATPLTSAAAAARKRSKGVLAQRMRGVSAPDGEFVEDVEGKEEEEAAGCLGGRPRSVASARGVLKSPFDLAATQAMGEELTRKAASVSTAVSAVSASAAVAAAAVASEKSGMDDRCVAVVPRSREVVLSARVAGLVQSAQATMAQLKARGHVDPVKGRLVARHISELASFCSPQRQVVAMGKLQAGKEQEQPRMSEMMSEAAEEHVASDESMAIVPIATTMATTTTTTTTTKADRQEKSGQELALVTTTAAARSETKSVCLARQRRMQHSLERDEKELGTLAKYRPVSGNEFGKNVDEEYYAVQRERLRNEGFVLPFELPYNKLQLSTMVCVLAQMVLSDKKD